jgi:hypothetical protein
MVAKLDRYVECRWVSPARAEDEQIAGVRVAAEPFLDLQRQAVHPTTHIGDAGGQPGPAARRQRDHARASTASTWASAASSTAPSMTTR